MAREHSPMRQYDGPRYLSSHNPERARFTALFREMAARLTALQKPDGYWPPSLLAPEGSPPETSGTGFFVYGLAWGVWNGNMSRRSTAAGRRWHVRCRLTGESAGCSRSATGPTRLPRAIRNLTARRNRSCRPEARGPTMNL
jgi:hypothetical protein